MMPGYQTYRTAAPALVRVMRGQAVVNTGFLALILAAGFAIDRLAGTLIIVVENFAK
jgi:hypothetical protein